MSTQQENRWSGKLLDANGRQGTVEVELGGKGNKQSSWTVQLVERDGPPLIMKGESTVEFDGKQLRMKGEQAFRQDQTIEWEIDLRAESADLYAKSAMVGQYAVRGAHQGFPLTRGVMILWQFQ